MMYITYNSANFPHYLGSNFQGSNQLTFGLEELVWSAITVGRANIIDVLSNGVHSEYEILYRASLLFANLAQDGQTLAKSSAYEHLDPSEKSAVSYFLGLTLSKLLSEKLLNISYLLHIDVYRDQFTSEGRILHFAPSRSRLDLIGFDKRNGWIVIESKGRTNKMEPTLLETAKSQARGLRFIGSEEPYLRIGLITHFGKGRLSVDWSDPEGYSGEYFDVKIEREHYLRNYYKLIYNVIRSKYKDINDYGDYITHTFEAINLTIGLKREVFEAYSSSRLLEIPSLGTDEPQALKSNNQEGFVGGDGVLIKLGNNWQQLLDSNKWAHK